MKLFPTRILPLSWLFLISFITNLVGINLVLVAGQCKSDQQSMLLQMKDNLIFNSTLSVHLVQWSQSTDCCNWSGVDCDENGRVIGLDLRNESISNGIENATGLFSLQHLQSLNLAFNSFNGAQIPSRLANLSNLTYLNLSFAGFVGQIPSEISGMTRLVTLDLSCLSFLGYPVLKLKNPNLSSLLQNLTELRELRLDGVNISSHGNEWCQALSFLPNLQILSLYNCFLFGPINSSLAKIRSLSVIRLGYNDLSSPFPDFLSDFSNLTYLHLSYSGLYGKCPEEIFKVSALETLELSSNKLLEGSFPEFPHNLSLRTLMLYDTSFSGILLYSIGNLKNLSTLELGFCNFTGPIPTSVANLSQLVYLDLSSNKFDGQIPSFHKLKKLTYLDLSRNDLTGSISFNWEQLLNLVHVDLRYNLLGGGIPPSLFSLPSLQELHLANNKFEGQIPEFPNASSSVLGSLDLSGNRLEGPISNSVFELKYLHILLLSSNKFNGIVHHDSIRRLGNLTRLDLSSNNLTVDATSSDSSFPPSISTLILASCRLTEIPNLKNQTILFYLDLSDNYISGKIPNWIWEVGNVGLIHLNLSYNFLEGLQEPYSVSDLCVLDLHSNWLQGKIPRLPPDAVYLDYSKNNFVSSLPADIGDFLAFALFFSISNNSLTGVIPESICNATSLQVLDLSNNKLNGRVPSCLFEMSDTLGVLNLRRNILNGTLSDSFPSNCSLQTLDLNGNQLEGRVPKSLATCALLEVLDLGNNQLYDTFPCWLQNAFSLHVLVLRSNNFSGNISCRENNVSWPMLQIIDLASNRFSGRLPQKWLLNLKAMMVDEDEGQSVLKPLHFEILSLSRLYYQNAITVTSKGLEMKLTKILTLFTSVDFSNNNFEGPIPEEIGQLKSLYALNFSHNALTGSIPSSVGYLRRIESLDLSMNNLSGTIPPQFASLNFLSVLNLSYNHFEGKIPSSTQLQSFLPNSFEGNEELFGPPLTNDCPTNSNELPPSVPTALSNEIDWQFIVGALGFAVGFGAVVSPLTFSLKANKWYDDRISRFLNRRR